jgi:hypothetical protein
MHPQHCNYSDVVFFQNTPYKEVKNGLILFPAGDIECPKTLVPNRIEIEATGLNHPRSTKHEGFSFTKPSRVRKSKKSC